MPKIKGAMFQATKDLIALLDHYKVDPVKTLASILADDCKSLGYDGKTQLRPGPNGDMYEQRYITPEMRLRAAEILLGYIYPKRKAVEVSGDLNATVEHKLTTAEIEGILKHDPFCTAKEIEVDPISVSDETIPSRD